MPTYFEWSVIALIISVILFFVMRSISLWYFKINEVLKNQMELEKMFKSIYFPTIVEKQVSVEDSNEPINSELLNRRINENEVIVKVLKTNKVEIWNLSDWEDVIKQNRQHFFEKLS